MFDIGQHSDTTLWKVKHIGGGLEIDRRILNRSETTGVSHSLIDQMPTIRFLDRQAQLINTGKNPRVAMKYPDPQFFICHNRFSEGLNHLIIQDSHSSLSCNNLYDPISDIISEYDQKLLHLPDFIAEVFFDYTDLLEAVLLVSKRRHINISDIKDILTKLSNIYSKIYSLMISCNRNDIPSIVEELSLIKKEISSRSLLPTVEECEMEMEQTFATMNNEEKDDLVRLLRN